MSVFISFMNEVLYRFKVVVLDRANIRCPLHFSHRANRNVDMNTSLRHNFCHRTLEPTAVLHSHNMPIITRWPIMDSNVLDETSKI